METAVYAGSADAPQRLPRSGEGAKLIRGILNKNAHNNAAFRTGSELLAGKRACEWRVGSLARDGHAALLEIRLAQLQAAFGSAGILEECNFEDANEAAANGDVECIRLLRAHGINCSSLGADRAAGNGQLHVLKLCTTCEPRH